MDASLLHLDSSAAEPIYRQIVGQITRLIASGGCPEGTRLPSVRDVAAAHAVNPMTVSKAYSLLETQGLVVRERGKGMVVASLGAQSSAARLETLMPALQALARDARQLGLQDADVLAALAACLNSTPHAS